jgi:excisionase family DNA binding protein
MNAHQRPALLTVAQAAERLNTGERFIRRLIDERRIEFVRLGRKVRIPEDALDDFVRDGTVQPLRTSAVRHDRMRAA